MARTVYRIHDMKEYVFYNCNSGFDALTKMCEFLDMSHKDKDAVIQGHGYHELELIHNGVTYGVLK